MIQITVFEPFGGKRVRRIKMLRERFKDSLSWLFQNNRMEKENLKR